MFTELITVIQVPLEYLLHLVRGAGGVTAFLSSVLKQQQTGQVKMNQCYFFYIFFINIFQVSEGVSALLTRLRPEVALLPGQRVTAVEQVLHTTLCTLTRTQLCTVPCPLQTSHTTHYTHYVVDFKHRKNRKKLPEEHLIGCQGVACDM